MSRRAAIIGGGVIGGGWAARFLLNGWDVALFDPDPDAARKVDTVLENARCALPAIYDAALPPEGRLSFCDDVRTAVAGADWVQESVPERLDLKHTVHAAITNHAPAAAIIGSSTSGFKPSQLNAAGARAIVAHPFNPVYLLPLVELVGDADRCGRAAEILRGIGMFPLTIAQEIDAHIADRLLEAVWRESLWLVKDGIATTQEIDDAIRMGFGLRWAQMGLFETYRIAGGEAGMKHFMAQFGPALAWPWTKLTDVPEFDDALVDLIAGQSDAQSGHLTIRELEARRDTNLVGLLRALKVSRAGAGVVVRDHEAQLMRTGARDTKARAITVDRQVPPSWTDYNGHMNEAHYLELGSQATDRLMELIGADADYVARGFSYFTVESHLRFIAEIAAGDRVRARTRVLGADARKLHLFHEITRGDGTEAATVETLLLHVDLNTRKSCPPPAAIADAVQELAEQAADLAAPEGICLGVGGGRGG
ncbi:MAG: carnitine 3-dehydrogenase [Pseudomonadota bacterium]